jgi:hypothetical protein
MYAESERSSPFGVAPRGNETFYLRVEKGVETAQHRGGDHSSLFLSLPSSNVIPFDDILVNNKNLKIFLISKRKAPRPLGLFPLKSSGGGGPRALISQSRKKKMGTLVQRGRGRIKGGGDVGS